MGSTLTRRNFIKTGAGLVIGFYLPPRLVPAPRAAAAPFAPNAWVRVGTDGIVTLTVDKSERSEEHTSELQSQSNLVCRLLLEKKNQNVTTTTFATTSHSL